MLSGGKFRCKNKTCTSNRSFSSLRVYNAHLAQCGRARFTIGTGPEVTSQAKTKNNEVYEDYSQHPDSDDDERLHDQSHAFNPQQDDMAEDKDDNMAEDDDDNLDVPGLPSHYHETSSYSNDDDALSTCSDDLPCNSTTYVAASGQNSIPSQVQKLVLNGNFVVQKASRPHVSRIPTDLALLDLARLLDSARCPHYMFDKVIAWCKYAGQVGCNPTLDRLTSRDVFFSKLEKRLSQIDVTVPKFKSKRVQLETAIINGDHSLLTSEINYWDFEEQIRSLFQDQSIFGDINNLNVNPVNPYLPMREYKKSGAWYQDTIRAKNITGYDGNFLVGIVIAADRTGNTWNQRFGTEPLLFTLSIIKESLWHHPKVWRILAMIPCDKDYKGQAAGNLHNNRKGGQGHACRNYHTYLRVALESLRRVQSPTYIYWPYNNKGEVPHNAHLMYRAARNTKDIRALCRGEPLFNSVPADLMNGVKINLVLGDDQKNMNVVCSVSHIILDGEGADKFTCRHVGKQKKFNRISRGCDCTFDECDDPFVNCHPVSQAKIIEAYYQTKWSDTYLNQPDGVFEHEMVDTCAVHACENAWWPIDFGYQPNGMYSGPLPIDSLHAFEEGNNKRILTLILGEQNSSHAFCARVDNVVDLRLRRNVPKQGASKRLPRLSYSRGISSLSLLAAHERVGVMCALTIVTLSLIPQKKGHYIMGRNPEPYTSKKERDQVVLDRLVFCQLSLLFHSWVDNGPHALLFVGKNGGLSADAHRNRNAIQKAISLLGELQKMVFPREQGDGHHTQKFHDWYVHTLPSLIHAGNGRRIKADVSEKQHKYFCKAPGQTAQKHSQEVFLRGVCNRLHTTDVLNHTRALFELDHESEDNEEPPREKFDGTSYKKHVSSPCFLNIETATITWRRGSDCNRDYTPFVKNMIVYGCNHLKQGGLLLDEKTVSIFTELNIDDVVLRCHPHYRKQVGAWFDWAMIKWKCEMKREWRASKTLWRPSSSSQTTHREVLLSLHDHLESAKQFKTDEPLKPGDCVEIFVPARLLAFVEGRSLPDSDVPVMYAIIHSCESECATDSLITRRWKKLPGAPKKACQVVEVSSIACPCYVVEAEPGFHEDNSPQSHDMLIHEVFDRRTSWGNKFLEVVDRGLTTVCHKDVKSKLDKIARINHKDRKGKPPFTRNRDDNESTRDSSGGSRREKKQRIA